MSIFHGSLKPEVIVKLAEKYGMRFDLAPEQRATVVKTAETGANSSETVASDQGPRLIDVPGTGSGFAAVDANRRAAAAGDGGESN